MTPLAFHFDVLAARQHGVAAGWQLLRRGLRRSQVDAVLRGRRRVFRDVCALHDLDELGWYMAAALAYGPNAAISHLSALMLLELRPFQPHPVHVSFTGGGRRGHEGTVAHRRTRMDVGTCHGIPVTSPAQSLKDASLRPHELYRAVEEAETRGYALPLNDLVCTRRAVRGRTRSDAEARFILLCHEHRFPLPLVNHRLNGFETDFHWPRDRLVVEVDGYEHHRERVQFNRDRHRGLVHLARGWQVVRVSADHVHDDPALVAAALRATTGW